MNRYDFLAITAGASDRISLKINAFLLVFTGWNVKGMLGNHWFWPFPRWKTILTGCICIPGGCKTHGSRWKTSPCGCICIAYRWKNAWLGLDFASTCYCGCCFFMRGYCMCSAGASRHASHAFTPILLLLLSCSGCFTSSTVHPPELILRSFPYYKVILTNKLWRICCISHPLQLILRRTSSTTFLIIK